MERGGFPPKYDGPPLLIARPHRRFAPPNTTMKASCIQRQQIAFILLQLCQSGLTLSISPSKIRALSLDVTGTVLATREPVIKSYHDAALWAKLPDPPTQAELKHGFKIAFQERCTESPCFGGVEGISGRDWWKSTVERVLYIAKNPDASSKDKSSAFRYSEEEFERYFRRVYQHFGSPSGYMVLDDAQHLLDTLQKQTNSNNNQQQLLLGITSNTPTRHMESVLPMLNNLHNHFSWFTCSQDAKAEKPSIEIFESSYQSAKFWIPDLQKDEVLHVGDSYACDYCGAKRFGFQALLLDRSDNPNVNAYQDWLDAPDYEGKSLEDVKLNTITSLVEVAELLLTEEER
jgi:REG-2-like HAD superfamily hydrolase